MRLFPEYDEITTALVSERGRITEEVYRDWPPDPCRYPNCSCHFDYQGEGSDACPKRT